MSFMLSVCYYKVGCVFFGWSVCWLCLSFMLSVCFVYLRILC